jgi:hypothetical protein
MVVCRKKLFFLPTTIRVYTNNGIYSLRWV